MHRKAKEGEGSEHLLTDDNAARRRLDRRNAKQISVTRH
jgi:hypothetical protein